MGSIQSPTPAVGPPNDPIFTHLAHLARNSNKVIIRDPLQNLEADNVRFLRDILQFRLKISSALPADILDGNGLIKSDGVYILLSAPSSYQFLVALFAILAIGGAAVLLPPNIPPEEVITLGQKCDAAAAAYAPEYQSSIDATRDIAKQTWGRDIVPVPITLDEPGKGIDVPLTVEENITFSANRPALVQFTSGTTGTPKGVMHARRFFNHQVEVYFGCPMSEANCLEHLLGPDAVYLSYRSFHWGGGIRNATAAILAGVCTEIYNHDATPAGIWERLRRGDVKFFICWAAMWTQMKVFYEEHLSALPEAELKEYADGVRGLRLAKSDSNPLTPSVKRFWREMLGVSIGVNYAAAEMSISMGKSGLDEEEINEATEKYRSSLDGGVCETLRSYVDELEATKAAFDEEGYYKTGDLGHYDGKKYTIDGRVSQNFIVFNGRRVPLVDVEESLMALPYIAEAYVVGVPDAEYMNRTGVLIRVKEGQPPSLQKLRDDMRLTEHKLPTLLRHLKAGDEIPKTHSGKVDLRKASSVYFPQSVEGNLGDLPGEVEVWKLK